MEGHIKVTWSIAADEGHMSFFFVPTRQEGQVDFFPLLNHSHFNQSLSLLEIERV